MLKTTPSLNDSTGTSPPAREPTVVIVGAGFSGAVTAVQLLRQATTPLKVVLVNESGRMARGVAYGTRSAAHVLNVPAGNMSALADDPDDFLRYCRWVNLGWQAGSFVPRRLYGAYLESLLSAVENSHAATTAPLERIVGRVARIEPPKGSAPARVELEDGTHLLADRVVLAFGHFAPGHPLSQAQRDTLGDAYVPDPWRCELDQLVARKEAVLLLGAGLTALDMVVTLDRAGHEGPLWSLSRRGLKPQGHRQRDGRPATVDVLALLQRMGPTLRGQVRELRRALAQAAASGEDWRDTIGALRPHTPRWWQSLSNADRRRFLRHVQVHWDTLRHRCAPEAMDCQERRVREHGMQLLAGRVVDVRRAGAQFQVSVRPRGQHQLVTLTVDRIVNCTAPSTRLDHCGSPLVLSLIEQGHLVADDLGLGVRVDAQLALIDRAGAAQPWLRYIGPMLKARDWEATAIPELRVHAQALARQLHQELLAAAQQG